MVKYRTIKMNHIEENDEEWIYPGNNPEWKTNFECYINKMGKWRIESDKYKKGIYGKWLFKIVLKEGKPCFPTYADQNNFMSGLLECDWHNDNFQFEDGTTRCSSWGNSTTKEFLKRIRIFKGVIEFYERKYGGQTKLNMFLNDK